MKLVIGTVATLSGVLFMLSMATLTISASSLPVPSCRGSGDPA